MSKPVNPHRRTGKTVAQFAEVLAAEVKAGRLTQKKARRVWAAYKRAIGRGGDA